MSDHTTIILPADDAIIIDVELDRPRFGDTFLDGLPDLLTIYNQAKSNSKELTDD